MPTRVSAVSAQQLQDLDVVLAVTSRLWNRSPMDCCGRMLTSSTALGEMSTPTHRRPRFSAATHVVAQPQAEESQPKGTGSENSPPFLPNESAEPGEPPSPGLEFTLADLRAGPEERVCLARGSAVLAAQIL